MQLTIASTLTQTTCLTPTSMNTSPAWRLQDAKIGISKYISHYIIKYTKTAHTCDKRIRTQSPR